jgi:hypothetical protein
MEDTRLVWKPALQEQENLEIFSIRIAKCVTSSIESGSSGSKRIWVQNRNFITSLRHRKADGKVAGNIE